jgi:hypothetical protein
MRFLRATIAVIRSICAREVLGEEPATLATHPTGAGRRLLRLLFAIEPLPLDPPAPPRRRRALLRTLFAPERLPLDPVPASPRRRSRLAALLAPERLDDSPP